MKTLDEAMREAARALRDEYTGGCACDYPQCDCDYDCERDDRTVEVLRDPLLAALRALDEAGYVLVPKTVTPSTAAAVLGLSEIDRLAVSKPWLITPPSQLPSDAETRKEPTDDPR